MVTLLPGGASTVGGFASPQPEKIINDTNTRPARKAGFLLPAATPAAPAWAGGRINRLSTKHPHTGPILHRATRPRSADGRFSLGGSLARFDAAGGRRIWRGLLLAGAAAFLVAGCVVQPHPITDAEIMAQAAADRQAMFAGQEPLTHPLTLQEAYARALKYNLDRRAKLMEQAVAYDGLEVGNFDLLPKLTADAGYFTRDNTQASSNRSNATGAQSLG